MATVFSAQSSEEIAHEPQAQLCEAALPPALAGRAESAQFRPVVAAVLRAGTARAAAARLA